MSNHDTDWVYCPTHDLVQGRVVALNTVQCPHCTWRDVPWRSSASILLEWAVYALALLGLVGAGFIAWRQS